MLSSIERIVFALPRFAAGAGLALIGAGLLREDPRVPVAIVQLATQPPFGGLWWALVSLAAGIALMLHALPSPPGPRGGSSNTGMTPHSPPPHTSVRG